MLNLLELIYKVQESLLLTQVITRDNLVRELSIIN